MVLQLKRMENPTVEFNSTDQLNYANSFCSSKDLLSKLCLLRGSQWG